MTCEEKVFFVSLHTLLHCWNPVQPPPSLVSTQLPSHPQRSQLRTVRDPLQSSTKALAIRIRAAKDVYAVTLNGTFNILIDDF